MLVRCGVLAGLAVSASLVMAADVHVPAIVEAGHGFSISADGGGAATLYLIGPDHVVKRSVNLGGDLQVQSSDVRTAGRYQLVLCDSSCHSTTFEVRAAQPAQLSFFLHPSRVPVSARGSIDATAFVFDAYWNLVLTPATVDFKVVPAGGAGFSRQLLSRNGVAWMSLDSSRSAGTVHVTASLGKAQEARVIEQVATEACGLRMRAAESGNRVTIETDPIRDCTGNALPDGTIVSFTKVDRAGRSTVDTPIKKGIARTQFSVDGPARISVACGVALGNELAVNGKL